MDLLGVHFLLKELKIPSDILIEDTLWSINLSNDILLPENQKRHIIFVFDKITIIVGRNHLYEAIKIIPDWWGITVAKIDSSNRIVFHTIREAEKNKHQKGISIARLLWREEALSILENRNDAKGIRSKQREIVYDRLAKTLDLDTLKNHVRDALLVSREGWRSA